MSGSNRQPAARQLLAGADVGQLFQLSLDRLPTCPTAKSFGLAGRRKRAGFTVLELLIAAMVLAAVASLTVLTAARLQSGRARLTQRTLARQLLANTAERVDALEFDELTSEAAAAMTVPMEFSSHLPKAQLTVEVDPLQLDGLSVKRVVIRASYASAGVPRNARLVFWRFAHREE